MNHQTINSSFANSSAPSNLSPLVTSDVQPVAPADSSVPKVATRKSKSLARPSGALVSRAAKSDPPVAAKSDLRCRHYTFTGRRCRLAPSTPSPAFVSATSAANSTLRTQDLSSAFGSLSRLNTPSGIYAFLTQVAVLLVQNRISTRRAAVLSYLGQTLLRALPAVEDELQPEERPFIFDLPRPKRDDDISPERAYVNRMAELGARCKTPVALDGYDGYTSDMDKSK